MDKHTKILLVAVFLIASFELGKFTAEETNRQNLNSSEEVIAAIRYLAKQASSSDVIEVRKTAGLLYITAGSLHGGSIDHFIGHVNRFAVEELAVLGFEEAIRRFEGRQSGGIEEPEVLEEEGKEPKADEMI